MLLKVAVRIRVVDEPRVLCTKLVLLSIVFRFSRWIITVVALRLVRSFSSIIWRCILYCDGSSIPLLSFVLGLECSCRSRVVVLAMVPKVVRVHSKSRSLRVLIWLSIPDTRFLILIWWRESKNKTMINNIDCLKVSLLL